MLFGIFVFNDALICFGVGSVRQVIVGVQNVFTYLTYRCTVMYISSNVHQFVQWCIKRMVHLAIVDADNGRG